MLTEEEFNKVYPHGCYGGYKAGLEERAKFAQFGRAVPEFDTAGFIAVADENRARGFSNE